MARGIRFLFGLAALFFLIPFTAGCSSVGPEKALAQDDADTARFERLRKEAADAFGRNDWSQNVALSQQALEIAGRTRVPPNSEARLRTNLGQAYRALGKWREGVAELERAQALFAASEKDGEKAGVTLFVRFQVASTYYFVSTETDHSAPILERAFELNHSFWDVAEPVSRIDKGVRGFLRDSMKYVVELHYRSGFSRPEAVSDIDRVIRTLDQPDEADLRAMGHFRLAVFFESRNENDNAERYYRDALQYYDRTGADKDSLGTAAIIYNDLGSIYYNRLQMERAQTEMHKAIDRMNRSTGVPKDIAGLIRAQAIEVEGAAARVVGGESARRADFDKDLAQRLNQAGQRGDAELQAFLHSAIGSRAMERAGRGADGKRPPSLKRDLAEADRHSQAALVLARKLKVPVIEAIALHNLGEASVVRGQWAAAREHFSAAAEIMRQNNRRANLAITSTALGYTCFKLNKPVEARQAYDEAIQQFEAIARQVANPAEAAVIRHPAADPYVFYADLLRAEGSFIEAARYLERGRAQGLARQTLASGRPLPPKFNAANADQQRAFADYAKIPPSDLKRRRIAREALRQSEEKLDRVRLQLAEEDPLLKAVDFRPPSGEQIKALAKDPRTLYLSYALVDRDRAFVLALGPGVKAAIGGDGIAAFSLPGGAAIAGTLAGWREALTAPVMIERYGNGDPKVTEAMAARAQKARDDEPARASAAGRALLGALEQKGLLDPKRIDHIVVAGDGPMLAIPFAALRDRSGNRMVDRFSVAARLRLTPFSFASESRRTAPASRPRYRLVYAANPPTDGAKADPRRLMAGATEPLPAAENAAEGVARRRSPCLALRGKQAREAAVKQAMTQAETLLFATHGWYEKDFGLHSWLALAPERDGGEDGLLEAQEILGLPLRAKLAVLMACQSGEGDAAAGEGLLGLVWSFWAAGCPRVVASGWPVNESSSALLVERFFAAQEKGERAEKALRTAMRAVRDTKLSGERTYAHPFYWAGFQLFEDARIGSR